jgi:hypothetical protein
MLATNINLGSDAFCKTFKFLILKRRGLSCHMSSKETCHSNRLGFMFSSVLLCVYHDLIERLPTLVAGMSIAPPITAPIAPPAKPTGTFVPFLVLREEKHLIQKKHHHTQFSTFVPRMHRNAQM